MSLLACFLLTLAVVDLVRWTPEATSPRRTAMALACGAVVSAALAALVGAGGAGAVAVAAAGLGPAAAWVGADHPRLRRGGTTPLVVVAVPAAQALLALAAGLFALSTANRVVRLVLSAAGTPPGSGEANLRGGRLLGPLERAFILALALAGDLTAAAVVIAAKGVLRLPEIRSAREERRGGADVVTEYFLVGTFTSWLLAVGLAGLVRLAG